jgi:RimJ/RimL family protein N-acetyltransferase
MPPAASPAPISPLKAFPAPLRGKRIVLRPFVAKDLRDLREAVEETRPALYRFIPWGDQHRDDANTAAFLAKAAADFKARKMFALAVHAIDGGRFLGGGGLNVRDFRARYYEIGYWIRASAEGRGFVQEGVRLVTAAAFEHMEANRVELRCDPTNERSLHVARRAGYVHEGRNRRAAVRCDGTVRDLEVFAMVREDYEAAKARWAAEPFPPAA